MSHCMAMSALPDIAVSVGIGEVCAQSTVINPVPVIVVIATNPEIPIIIGAVIAGGVAERH
jgi:hypothetical protein